jgi:hypothetical protein
MGNFIENDRFRMWMENGIIFVIYKPGIIIDLATVSDVVAKRIEMAEGISRPIYGEGPGVKYFTREARDYGFTEEAMLYSNAHAWKYDSLAIKVVLNWVLKFVDTKVPCKAFKSKEKALLWLEQYK